MLSQVHRSQGDLDTHQRGAIKGRWFFLKSTLQIAIFAKVCCLFVHLTNIIFLTHPPYNPYPLRVAQFPCPPCPLPPYQTCRTDLQHSSLTSSLPLHTDLSHTSRVEFPSQSVHPDRADSDSFSLQSSRRNPCLQKKSSHWSCLSLPHFFCLAGGQSRRFVFLPRSGNNPKVGNTFPP